jgi:SAM-dependent methyltransferase
MERFVSYIQHIYNLYIIKRVQYDYKTVTTGLGVRGDELPAYSARLFSESKLLKEAIGSYHAEKSLEIGCGYGRLTPWIAEHSNQHYAIEPENTLLKDARELNPQVHFEETKIQNLPFPDGYFNLCVSWTVLQHVPPKYFPKAISELKRVSAPSSVMILTEGVGTGCSEKYWYWEHTLEEWKKILSPWELTSCNERKLETTFKDPAGLVMRFERK